MAVRAKFKVHSKAPGAGEEAGGTVTLWPVTSGSAVNADFYKYTPGGSITLSTINPAAYEGFEEGKEYYVDFTPAD